MLQRQPRKLLLAKVLALMATLALIASAKSEAASTGDAWAALREPGVVAVMRHAIAPGTGDPADFELGDCSTQRNLDDRGRAQARAIGAAFRDNGIRVDRILTSQWCRCRETARELGLAPVQEFPPLTSFFRDRSRAEEQTRRAREYLAHLPPGRMVLLVTHQVNITALTGVYPRSGEALAVTAEEDGTVRVVGRIISNPD
ncbi:histidine phosphatase family protein [Arhodomonas sp. SL1]|uniref:histidine phosphatase family protein n=1 Tax=Arhodomonas sp. SL1 TaxID=3425691 RepID=UPI003F8803AC